MSKLSLLAPLVSAALLAAPAVLALPGELDPTPGCGDGVKKPTDDGKEQPPKASTDPLCGDGVKKPTDDTPKEPPKT